MNIVQEMQNSQKRKITFKNRQENYWMQGIILLFLLKKEIFRIKVIYLKEKKKNQKKNQQEKN